MRKKVKLSVHNQWRVVHNDITDSGGVANLKMSIIKIYSNIKTSITLKRNFPVLLTFLLFSLLGLLYSLKSCECPS